MEIQTGGFVTLRINAPSLENKSIVVVGGTSGLGFSAARAFVNAGAKVVIVGKNPEKIENARTLLGNRAMALTADATDPKAAVAAVQVAVKNFGTLHGLYHVAGGSGRKMGDGPLHEISDEGWRWTQEQNLTSIFYSNRAAANQFLQQKTGGTVLNMTSVLGFAPTPHFFSTHAYAAAKAAIIGLTRAAAAHYASANIRFNALAPALVATPMSERAQTSPEILNFIATKQPLDGGRIGHPEDLDGAAVFFMSDASRFVTGQVLAIDGGWNVSDGHAPTPTARTATDPSPAATNVAQKLAWWWNKLTK